MFFVSQSEFSFLKLKIRKNKYDLNQKIPSRESKKRIYVHGKIVFIFTEIKCRISKYFLRVHKLTGFGKGNLSRSEPLFCHPNPSFNSIGRAARENAVNRFIAQSPWLFEILKINFSETFFLAKNKTLYLGDNLKKKNIRIFFEKFDPFFPRNFTIYKRYRETFSYLKSGIKYGGSFIIYYGNLMISSHKHSKCILIMENLDCKEKFCIKCSLVHSLDWTILQGKIRLAQQVSKKINILKIFKKKKSAKESNKCVLVELNIERYLLK